MSSDMTDEDAAEFDTLKAQIEELRRIDGGGELLDFVEKLAKQTGRTILEFGTAVAPLALEAGKNLLVSLATAELEKALKKN